MSSLDYLAAELARLSDYVTQYSARAALSPRAPLPKTDRASAILKLRRERDGIFGADLFADPAWDMLLDLMAARAEGKRVSISSLCIASAVPPTTALRWVATMVDRGHFIRTDDGTDGRRVWIELSADAVEKMMLLVAAEEGA